MSSRASGGAFAACLITAAIVGFAGGAFFGTQAGAEEPNGSPSITNTTSAPPGGNGDNPGGEETEPAATGVTIEAAQESVGANERIDLTGALEPPEEGIELRLERSVDGGEWQAFADITATTNADGGFSTWVQTGQAGENTFRFVRADDDAVASNEVTVTVG